MKLIRKGLVVEDPAPANLYLGCNHELKTITTKAGTATTMVYNMESYLASTVEKYIKVASKATGKQVQLKKANTPFLAEDRRSTPAGAPCSKGKGIMCPWCHHSFPIDQAKAIHGPSRKTAKQKELPSSTDENVDNATTGLLQPHAASILMKILYAARMARFDLLRATCRLACFITKWTEE